MSRIVIAVSLHSVCLCGRGSKRLVLLVLTVIIFSKFTEARLSQLPAAWHFVLIWPRRDKYRECGCICKNTASDWIQDKCPQLGAALA
jgi:hypothetical protein